MEIRALDLMLDTSLLELTGRKRVRLTRRAAQLLEALMRQPGELVAKDVFLELLCAKADAAHEYNLYRQHLHLARQALGQASALVTIDSVHGRGLVLRNREGPDDSPARF